MQNANKDPFAEFVVNKESDDPFAEFVVKPEVSKTESFLRGATQGASFGLADEITGAIKNPIGAARQVASIFGNDKYKNDMDRQSYVQERDESRANYKEAELANPSSYLAGEVGGSVATGLATGGIGALKTGASLGKTVANLATRGAVEGGLTSVGTSKSESASDIAKGVLIGATTGASIGAAIPVVGKGLNASKKLIKSGYDTAADMAGKGSKLFGASEADAKLYANLLKNPDEFDNAIKKYAEYTDGGKVEVREMFEDIYKQSSKVGKDNISNFRGEAVKASQGKLDDINNLYGKTVEELDILTKEVSDTDVFGSGVRKGIKSAKKYLSDSNPFYQKALKENDLEKALKIKSEAALRARQALDAQYKNSKKLGKSLTVDEEVVLDVRSKLDNLIKNELPGGEFNKLADNQSVAFFSNAKPFLDDVMVKGKLDNKKMNTFFKGSGSQEIFETKLEKWDKFKDYVNTYLNDESLIKKIQDFDEKIKPIRGMMEINRFAGSMGKSTGKMATPVLAEVAFGSVLPGVGALTTVLNNPATTLRVVSGMRKAYKAGGIEKAVKIFGQKNWDKFRPLVVYQASKED